MAANHNKTSKYSAEFYSGVFFSPLSEFSFQSFSLYLLNSPGPSIAISLLLILISLISGYTYS